MTIEFSRERVGHPPLSFDHTGTFVFQITLGPGLGVSGWSVTTNTKAGCVGCE